MTAKTCEDCDGHHTGTITPWIAYCECFFHEEHDRCCPNDRDDGSQPEDAKVACKFFKQKKPGSTEVDELPERWQASRRLR